MAYFRSFLQKPGFIKQHKVRKVESIPHKPVLNGEAVPEFRSRKSGIPYLAPELSFESPDSCFLASLVQTVSRDEDIGRPRRVPHE